MTYIDIGAILSQLTCISFLTQCTSATFITFQNICKSNSEIIPYIAPISLPHLQHFDVVTSTTDICTTILAPYMSILELSECRHRFQPFGNSSSSHIFFDTPSLSPTPAQHLRLADEYPHSLPPHACHLRAGVCSSKIIETFGIYF